MSNQINRHQSITSTPIVFLLLLFLALLPHEVHPLDTIFSKGGTCLYKIYNQYQRCMEFQNARLTSEKDYLAPIYTREALTESVNKISCCAYWEFLGCVEEAAEQFCTNDRTDMEAYTRQLGSAVPLEVCLEEFPRDSPKCYSQNARLLFNASTSLVPLHFFWISCFITIVSITLLLI